MASRAGPGMPAEGRDPFGLVSGKDRTRTLVRRLEIPRRPDEDEPVAGRGPVLEQDSASPCAISFFRPGGVFPALPALRTGLATEGHSGAAGGRETGTTDGTAMGKTAGRATVILGRMMRPGGCAAALRVNCRILDTKLLDS